MGRCRIKGTIYQLQVVEKKQPKEPKQLTPRNLVAIKKATIVKMEVETGQKVVDLHEQVIPGQILVSGLIGKEEKKNQLQLRGRFGEKLGIKVMSSCR